MKENNKEMEIDLMQIAIYLFRKWYVIIGAAIVGAVVAGIFFYVSNTYFPEVRETLTGEERLGYEIDLENYESDKERLKTELLNLQNAIDTQTKYNAESVFMNIDPYAEWRMAGQIYIDTDYKIMPEMTYQDEDIADSILATYSTMISQGNLYPYIVANLSTEIEESDLKDLITTGTDGGSNTMQLSVIHSDKAVCQEIYQLCVNYIQDKQVELKEKIGDFSLNIIETEASLQSDMTLAEEQQLNLQKLIDLQTTYEEELSEYEGLSKPAANNYLKSIILGILVGGVLACGIYVVLFIVKDWIWSKEELEAITGVATIGCVKKVDQNGELFSKLAMHFEEVMHGHKAVVITSTVKGEGKSFVTDHLAEAIRQSGRKVLVLNSPEELESLGEKLTQYTEEYDYCLIDAPAYEQAEALRLCKQAQNVLLIAKEGKATKKQCRELTAELAMHHCTVVGIILNQA